MYTISQLFIYPVKSLAGIPVKHAEITERGLQYDRGWMLVDENGRFISQRECPEMALLQTAIEGDRLLVFHKQEPGKQLAIDLHPVAGESITVSIWNDQCTAWRIEEADQWFTNQLFRPCRLVYLPPASKRAVDPAYAHHNETTGFADGYPLLIIGQESLNDLNNRLESPIPVNRFRPNIVFEGGQPYDEDCMELFSINQVEFSGVKLCARCTIITIDQDNAVQHKEPLKTLAGYRAANNKIYFGQNLLHKGTGTLRTGDLIEVKKTKLPFAFDEPRK